MALMEVPEELGHLLLGLLQPLANLAERVGFHGFLFSVCGALSGFNRCYHINVAPHGAIGLDMHKPMDIHKPDEMPAPKYKR
jgi:hypothetical protein